MRGIEGFSVIEQALADKFRGQTMKQVIQHFRSGLLRVEEVPETICRPGGILVSNVVSLISAGTEKMTVDLARKSLLGKARERPDLVRQVLQKLKRDGLMSTMRTVRARLETPVALGYSCAGIVCEVGPGAKEFQVGDRVACAGMNYASHAETVFIPRNLAVKMPAETGFDEAAFVTLGAIALQGVRTAEARLGETVAVIGLGLIGQLTVQILKAAGCRVIGIDLDQSKISLATELGADAAIRRDEDVEGLIRRLTDGLGVDAVIITAAAESNDPVELAGAIARDRAIISVVGAVGLSIPRKQYYEKELQLRLSRSYGPGRYDRQYEELGIDYPVGYVRWTERRNMQEFLRLTSERRVRLERLITHRFPIMLAEEAYEIVTGQRREDFLGVLLDYDRERSRRVPVSSVMLTPQTKRQGDGKIGIGMIGAGNFARSVLLPRLAANRRVALRSVATATGKNGFTLAKQYGFTTCTTDYHEVLADDNVDAVIITTRHDTHARMAAAALLAGKDVFVEKPLAIDIDDLNGLATAVAERNGRVMVGFNRRFSPLSAELRNFFREAGPLAIVCRINAGAIPAESWIQGDEGGGRILGEVCHFVDYLQFLTGADPVEVFGLRHPAGPDTVSILLRMSDGSTGTIAYLANGDRGVAKERIEVYAGGRTAILDDFRRLDLWHDGRCRTVKRMAQEKGFDEEIAAFLDAVGQRRPMPITWESLLLTTLTTLRIEESIRTGVPVRIELSVSI